jgi:N-acetylglucosamine-6-phosphate deacetylase
MLFDHHIPVATHLFNAMSPLQHRSPGVVGAVFNHKRVMSSLVADGYHVDFNVIKIAKKIMGERLFIYYRCGHLNRFGPLSTRISWK